MSIHSEIPENKKVEHLILLVGGNPLPNAVAGRLLVRPGGRITLVHSADTYSIAERLKKWFERMPHRIPTQLSQTSESIAGEIAATASGLVKEGEQIGLNYTGGTKAMAVHSHHILYDKIKPQHRSYLDPYTLSLRFDDGASCYVGTSLQVELDSDLMALHKQMAFDPKHLPEKRAMLPQTAVAIARKWSKSSFRRNWVNWFGGYDRKKKKTYGYLYHLNRGPGKDDTSGRYQNWVVATQLRARTIPFPPGVDSVLRQELIELGYPLQHTELNLGDAYDVAAHPLTNAPWVEDLCDWFKAQWLEHAVFVAMENLRDKHDLHAILLNVDVLPAMPSGSDGFEIDVAAVRGYQLFGISCTTSAKWSTIKGKMFEVAMRVRQLGGDESRLAVVSTTDKARGLEEEMQNTMGFPIKVFGMDDLADLERKLDIWIQTQIGEQGDEQCE